MRWLASVLAAVLLAVASLAVAAELTQPGDVPLPSDVTITPPDPSLPPEKAAFSGQWGEGKDAWDGILASILVVEKVDEKGADVIYAHGTASQWWITRPSWSRKRAEFTEKNELLVQLKNGTATYRLKGDKLEGLYRGKSCCFKITLTRATR